MRKKFYFPIFSNLFLFIAWATLIFPVYANNNNGLDSALSPCRIKGLENDVRCGSITVLENPSAAHTTNGRRIAIHYAVIPAKASRRDPDPLFVFAGGPGQSAIKIAPAVQGIFAKLNRRRDIVFIDQRGTGKSNALDCPAEGRALMLIRVDAPAHDARTAAKKCLDALQTHAAPAFYATTFAMADIEAVRLRLGYKQINLWGASYGTRAALEYARLYPYVVRSMVLDGVAPAGMGIPVSFTFDAEAALARLSAECAAENGCLVKAAQGKDSLVVRLERLSESLVTPRRLTVADPVTGELLSLEITRDIALGAVFASLYVPSLAALTPAIVDQALQGNFAPMLTLVDTFENGASSNLSTGMRLSVLCAEDWPRLSKETLQEAEAHRPFGPALIHELAQQCEIWPRTKVDEAYYLPLKSDIPTLLFSGGADPATPPRHAEAVAKNLRRAKHIIAPHLSHGVSSQGCAPDLITRFVESADLLQADGKCLAKLPRPLFYSAPQAKTLQGKAQ